MASFLTLVKDLARDGGTVAVSQITTVVNPTNPRVDKMVHWVQKAWLNIQNEQRDWLWMRAIADTKRLNTGVGVTSTPMQLIVGQLTYPPGELLGDTGSDGNDLRFSEWRGDEIENGVPVYRPWTLYDHTIGQSDEGELVEISYELWRTRYDRGSQDPNRPNCYAFAPDGSICFGPKPDKAYYVRGEFVKGPMPLAEDDDEPDMPSRFHDLITWEALKLMMLHDGQLQTRATEAVDILELRALLHRDQLPEIALGGGPLA